MSAPLFAPNSAHWPVPMAVHRLEGAQAVNEVLARIFSVMRATDVAQHPERAGSFYASADDLLQRVDVPEFHTLVKFIAQSLQATANQANAEVWPSVPAGGLICPPNRAPAHEHAARHQQRRGRVQRAQHRPQ